MSIERRTDMRIDTNNGRHLQIDQYKDGVLVMHFDERDRVEWSDFFDEGDIVMAINLLGYLRDNNMKEVFLMDEYTQHYCQNLIANGDISFFQIFQ